MSTEQNGSGQQDAQNFSGAEFDGTANAAASGSGENSGGGAGAGDRQGRFRRRRRRKKPGGPPGQPNGAVAMAAGGDDSGAGVPAAGSSEDGAGNSRGEGSGGQNSVEAEGQSQAPPQSQNRGQQNQNQRQAQGQGQSQQNQNGQPRRRKKKGKRFGQAGQGSQQQAGPGNRQQTHQPGNNFGSGGGGQNFGNGNGGGRRQKKARGGRAFVGPMDHSYRAVNGNYADAPPSTIQVNGNNGGGRGQRNQNMHDTGHQSQFLPTYYEPKPPTIAEDAPVKVYCFIEDLFVTAKITEAARKMGVKVAFVKADKEDLAKITDAPEEERAHLIIFDLNNINAKPMTVIPKIRTKMKKSVSIVGFLSHLQGDLKSKAMEAGCDSVMPRAAFSQALPGLLRRYGLEEDVEAQDAQHAYF